MHLRAREVELTGEHATVKLLGMIRRSVKCSNEHSRLRGEIIEHRVSGQTFRVVDIPPGYVHSIENVGERELVTLFWSSEVFDPQHPDTIASPVLPS